MMNSKELREKFELNKRCRDAESKGGQYDDRDIMIQAIYIQNKDLMEAMCELLDRTEIPKGEFLVFEQCDHCMRIKKECGQYPPPKDVTCSQMMTV